MNRNNTRNICDVFLNSIQHEDIHADIYQTQQQTELKYSER